MIVLDTTVLVYAVGEEHGLRAPARSLVEAIQRGSLQATTTLEAIQEFAHVRARRRGRRDAAALARAYATLLGPLLRPSEDDLLRGLQLFERHRDLGAFDAVLAAAALAARAEALVSADRSFGAVRGLPFVDLSSPGLGRLTSA
ncbi:MAG TPA: type II toxin-antitoxin system VapC family toxin [Gaiellaceae bacterium]|nr:type II toxin-antitoxin system VapC family toxin [Gaiellaceae bacterium]